MTMPAPGSVVRMKLGAAASFRASDRRSGRASTRDELSSLCERELGHDRPVVGGVAGIAPDGDVGGGPVGGHEQVIDLVLVLLVAEPVRGRPVRAR